MLDDFQRRLQFFGFRPEGEVEYLSQPLPYLCPEGAFDGESRQLLRARLHCGYSLRPVRREDAAKAAMERPAGIADFIHIRSIPLKFSIVEDLRYATSRGSTKPTTIWILMSAIDYVARLADIHAMIVSDNR
jgi:hypothetical protein